MGNNQIRHTQRRWPPPATLNQSRSYPTEAFPCRHPGHTDPPRRSDIHHAVSHRRRRLDITPCRVLPQEHTRTGVRAYTLVNAPDVHHAVGHRRRNLKYCSPVVYFHRSAPVVAFRAYTVRLLGPNVHHAVGHRRRQIATTPRRISHRSAPVLAFRAYRSTRRPKTRSTPRR